MIIREITEKDNKEIAIIIREQLKKYELDIPGTAYFDPELNELSSFYSASSKRQYFILTNDEGEILGGAGVAEYAGDASIAELQKLYISSKAQGHGYGYSLINKVIETAKTLGYSKLYLETHHNLGAATHMYEKIGFKHLDKPLDGSLHGTMDIFFLLKLDI